jgi:hypothetical protein
MRSRSNIGQYLTAGVLLLLGFSGPADACWVSWPSVVVPPSFHVLVQHGSTPMPGIKVEIFDTADLEKSKDETPWKPILILSTGSDGAVDIQNLKPGTYLVETKGPGSGSAVYAEVSAKGGKRRKNQIALEWPASWKGLLKTRTLGGELASNNPWVPFQTIQVELWTAGAETPLAVETAGAEGQFHFNETKPEIYILRVRGHQDGVGDTWQVDGEIPVELSSSSAALPQVPSLSLAMTSCGLSYSSCPIPNSVATASRRLRVGDPQGAVIAKAKYELLDQSGAVLANGLTNSDGMAEFPSDSMGKLTLVIASPGFTVLKQPLELLTPDRRARDLIVSMAVHGNENECSAVKSEKHAKAQ